MSDMDITPDATDSQAPDTQPQQDTTTDDTGRIPLSRFQKVTDENRTLRDQLEQLTAWKQEQEQAAMSELDRERVARETAEQQLADAQAAVLTLERGSLVRAAASAAGLVDPEDAIALCDLNSISTSDEAQAAVAGLIERKPHLVRAADTGPRPMGTPLSQPGSTPVPIGADGQPDERMAVGSDLLRMIQRGR